MEILIQIPPVFGVKQPPRVLRLPVPKVPEGYVPMLEDYECKHTYNAKRGDKVLSLNKNMTALEWKTLRVNASVKGTVIRSIRRGKT